MSGPGPDGGPALPGATIADAAGGGMHAALAITAALAGRADSGHGAYLDVSVAEGVLWLMSLAIDEQLALGSEVRPGSRRPLGPLRLLRDVPMRRRRSGSPSAPSRPSSSPTSAPHSTVRSWRPASTTTTRSPPSGTRSHDAFATRTRDEWVEALADADTCVAPVLEVAEVVEYPQFRARRVVGAASHPKEGALPTAGADAGGHGASATAWWRCPTWRRTTPSTS